MKWVFKYRIKDRVYSSHEYFDELTISCGIRESPYNTGTEILNMAIGKNKWHFCGIICIGNEVCNSCND